MEAKLLALQADTQRLIAERLDLLEAAERDGDEAAVVRHSRRVRMLQVAAETEGIMMRLWYPAD